MVSSLFKNFAHWLIYKLSKSICIPNQPLLYCSGTSTDLGKPVTSLEAATNIDLLADVAYKVRGMHNTFRSNYALKIRAESNERKLQLPVNHRTSESLVVIYKNQ